MLRITDKRAISTISMVGLIAVMLFLEAPQAQAVVPTITVFSPASAGVGTVVAISGTGFTGGVGVTFNGVASSSFAFLTDTQATATVPFGGTTGPISVVTPAGTATSSTVFTVTFCGPTAVDCTTDPSACSPRSTPQPLVRRSTSPAPASGPSRCRRTSPWRGQERLSMLEVAVPRSPSPWHGESRWSDHHGRHRY